MREKQKATLTLLGALALVATSRSGPARMVDDPNPMTLDLLGRVCEGPLKDRSDLVVTMIQRVGTSFLPTQDALKILREHGADKSVLDEVSKPSNFIRNMRVHVCHFEAPSDAAGIERDFTARMAHWIAEIKNPRSPMLRWPKLRGIPPDELPGPPTGFSDQSPRVKGTSYLVVSGSIRKKNGVYVATAAFVYEGYTVAPLSLGTLQDLPLDDAHLDVSAHKIIDTAMTKLNDEIGH